MSKNRSEIVSIRFSSDELKPLKEKYHDQPISVVIRNLVLFSVDAKICELCSSIILDYNYRVREIKQQSWTDAFYTTTRKYAHQSCLEQKQKIKGVER